jgi:hypothetical protein
VWQGFINVLESFSYKDSVFILATKKKGKKISELILPSNLILLAYMGLLKGKKSDPIIFRILNLDLLLLLLFSSLFRGLFILFGFNCKWASYKFT